MKKYLFTLLTLSLFGGVSAQKKSDLIAEVARLRAEKDSIQSVLNQTERSLSTAETKVASLETQATQLKETNQSLMNNLNNFITSSSERTSNIGRTLEALQAKESQLKAINNVFSSNDSIAFMVLTDYKKTLGENAQLGVENGAITVRMNNSFLFASDKADLSAQAKDFIGKIATVLSKHPGMQVTVVSTGVDKLDYIATKAAVVADLLETQHNINPERLRAVGRSGLADATEIKLHPAFDKFYLWTRDQVK